MMSIYHEQFSWTVEALQVPFFTNIIGAAIAYTIRWEQQLYLMNNNMFDENLRTTMLYADWIIQMECDANVLLYFI